MIYKASRENMVKYQLVARGITDENILKAFLKIPRHLFVPEELRHLAHNDSPLSIGEDQTISQPYIVALMLQNLELNEVLNMNSSDIFSEFMKGLVDNNIFSLIRFCESLGL